MAQARGASGRDENVISIDQETRDKYGEIRIFEGDYMDMAPGPGWHVIAVVQEQRIGSGTREEPCSGTGPSGGPCQHGFYGGCTQPARYQMPLTYTNTLVIMGRDKESSLAVMREEVDDLLTRVHSLEYQRDELKKDHDKIEKELENSKSHIKRQEELFESKCKKISDQEHRIAQHLETINRLETDIGKLRDEFGGAAIRAVLED